MARTPPARTAGQRPLIALVAIGVLVVAGLSLPSQLGTQGGGSGGPAAPGQPEAEVGRTAEVVGPVRGADVVTYVADRTAALEEAPEEVDTAVVSFSEVLRVEDALALVQDAGEVRAVLLRLPLELTPPQTVRVGAGEDPVALVDEVLASSLDPLVTEEQALRELLDSGTVDDAEFEAEYERRIESIVEAREAVEGDGDLVHAVVLRAPLAALRDLQGTTAIRLVDPAPPNTDVALSVFHGLLPSDAETVTFGRAA